MIKTKEELNQLLERNNVGFQFMDFVEPYIRIHTPKTFQLWLEELRENFLPVYRNRLWEIDENGVKSKPDAIGMFHIINCTDGMLLTVQGTGLQYLPNWFHNEIIVKYDGATPDKFNNDGTLKRGLWQIVYMLHNVNSTLDYEDLANILEFFATHWTISEF